MRPDRMGPAAMREQGSGSVLVLAGIACLLALAGGALLVAGAVHAKHVAQAAADLGALAAADRAVNAQASSPDSTPAGSPCDRARSVVAAHRAFLVECTVHGDGAVLVRTTAPSRLGQAHAIARAGPG